MTTFLFVDINFEKAIRVRSLLKTVLLFLANGLDLNPENVTEPDAAKTYYTRTPRPDEHVKEFVALCT